MTTQETEEMRQASSLSMAIGGTVRMAKRYRLTRSMLIDLVDSAWDIVSADDDDDQKPED